MSRVTHVRISVVEVEETGAPQLREIIFDEKDGPLLAQITMDGLEFGASGINLKVRQGDKR